jgi:DivIVA domain-containing protein
VIVFLLFIVVVLIGLTAAAVMGRIGGFMADPASSQAFGGVPAGSLSTDDIAALHFDQALRGYRMDEVDEVINALSARLGELETEVASLRAAGPHPPAVATPRSSEGLDGNVCD